MSGTGIDVPNLPKCPVPVLMSYQTYRSVRYRYVFRTELTEVSGTGIDAPNLPKCPVPVLMYRTYRNVRYRCCRTELTKVSDTGIDLVPILPKCPVPVLMSYRYRYLYRHRHRYRLGYVYRRYMFRAYPVFHGGTCLVGNYLYYAV